MRNLFKHHFLKKDIKDNFVERKKIKKRMLLAASLDENQVIAEFNSSQTGLTADKVEQSKEKYGSNTVKYSNGTSLFKRICNAVLNPFTGILIALAVVSVFTDIIFAAPEEKNYITVIIIATMIMLSSVLRFVQETRSVNSAAKLSKMVHITTCVQRAENGKSEMPLDDVVVGDIVYLSAGDMVPADIRILSAKDLFISQAALTGESEPVEKQPQNNLHTEVITEVQNLAFMGSNVISGSARA